MNFEYNLTKELKLTKHNEEPDFVVEGFIDADSFYLIKAEVYAHALDEFFDCTEIFKRRTSYMEKIYELASDDYKDFNFDKKFDNWHDEHC